MRQGVDLPIIPIDLEILQAICEICAFHERFLPKITPRNVTSFINADHLVKFFSFLPWFEDYIVRFLNI